MDEFICTIKRLLRIQRVWVFGCVYGWLGNELSDWLIKANKREAFRKRNESGQCKQMIFSSGHKKYLSIIISVWFKWLSGQRGVIMPSSLFGYFSLSIYNRKPNSMIFTFCYVLILLCFDVFAYKYRELHVLENFSLFCWWNIPFWTIFKVYRI